MNIAIRNLLTILIPSRNRSAELSQTLGHINTYKELKSCTVIVHDDASKYDEKYQQLVSQYKLLKLIESNERCGQAKGRNLLLRATETPFALFLDDDVRPQLTEFIGQILRRLTKEKDIAIVVPSLEADYLHYKDRRRSIRPTPPGNVRSFPGGACFVNKDLLLENGGFRDFFFYGLEETEFSLRLLAKGYRIITEPAVKFIHEHSPSERDSREYYFFYSRNHLLTFALNFPWILGIPYGTLKSLAWSARRPNFGRHRLLGLLCGFKDIFKYHRYHKSIGWAKSFNYIFHTDSEKSPRNEYFYNRGED